jgi:hypothetical protein
MYLLVLYQGVKYLIDMNIINVIWIQKIQFNLQLLINVVLMVI